MQIQIRTDNVIRGSEELQHSVETAVAAELERFGRQVTRVEVHLSDENGPKSAGDDICCMIEVRVAGRQPTAVRHNASQIDDAVAGAAAKMAKSLDRDLGRLERRRR